MKTQEQQAPAQVDEEVWRGLAEELGPEILDVEEAPPEELASPEALALLDRMLYKLRELEREQEAVVEVARRRTDDISQWKNNRVATLGKPAAFLRMVLEHAARTMQFAGKAKSVSLPSGRLGRRAQPDRLEIADQAAAVAFAKTYNRSLAEGSQPVPIKVVETVSVKDMTEVWQSTGVVPDGCVPVTARDDKPFVEVSHGG